MKSNLGQMWGGMPTQETRAQQDLEAKLYKLEQDIMELKQIVLRLIPPVQPVQPAIYRGCQVCGMTTERSMGYVCPHFGCPTRATSTNVQPASYLDLSREQA